MNSIAVFCGSGLSKDETHNAEAYQLGKVMASHNISLVYGGAKIGLMGKVADGVLENNGKAIGVIPDFLTTKEVVHTQLSELIITETMHERKLKMHDLSEGIIALPGGFGTLEELFEMLTWAQLGLHKKPIGLLNTNGFYNHLMSFIETMIQSGLLKPEYRKLVLISDSINDLLEQMENFEPMPVPRWMNKNQT